jgi:hypothetical protein
MVSIEAAEAFVRGQTKRWFGSAIRLFGKEIRHGDDFAIDSGVLHRLEEISASASAPPSQADNHGIDGLGAGSADH